MLSFEEIYSRNTWGFGSGHGSLPRVTKGYRNFLEDFIARNAIRSVVDLGCGDWQFSRLIDWHGADYLGLDIVPSVIEANKRRFGTRPRIRFATAPADFGDLPEADLLITKDVLQHLSTEAVQHFIAVAPPRFRYCLITNCATPEGDLNTEIVSGGFRPLDLRRAPFNLGAEAVYEFDCPAAISWRAVISGKGRRRFPGSRKIVLLLRRSESERRDYAS